MAKVKLNDGIYPVTIIGESFGNAIYAAKDAFSGRKVLDIGVRLQRDCYVFELDKRSAQQFINELQKIVDTLE